MRILPKVLYPLYEKRLERDVRRITKELRGARLPKHIAVMADGNRRWAREAGFSDVSHGHRVGAQKIAEMVQWADELGITLVTVYLLSTENLARSSAELEQLFEILADVARELSDPDINCRVRLVGHTELLPDSLSEALGEAESCTSEHSGVVVNVAVGYGGRQEIVDAVQALIRDELAQDTPAESLADAVTVDAISTHLYTKGQPDPDLVIRTSGEQRLSGFLLWQAAYSEIWFTDTYWPAFRRIDFLRALREYSSRSRRFGK
ncbi:(2Z,6E)-farnesyl diphosphate synthase [Corynebacterium ciconiae DSM 44920]|uniref:isoprenyl transferase n=1 Tax=Corynebacterium ciconiae TaxID=227319 RepID=UPI0003A3BB95|nr:isoprenyl transferase [Corynebacterium ciconiae]WKD61550.1 (2Z,6E)-farnesyl diphosphate synthase [Corynebacterium ciconiae DSM 44920]